MVPNLIGLMVAVDEHRARRRARYAANPEKVLESNRQWRAKNPEKVRAIVRESNRKYQAANPEKVLEGHLKSNRKQRAAHEAAMNVLKAGGCFDCGVIPSDLRDLDFHHKDPSGKLFTIANGWKHSSAELEAELEKCVVVCRPDHRMRHKVIRFFEVALAGGDEVDDTPLAPLPPKVAPRYLFPELALDFPWLLEGRPADADRRPFWNWWRGIGLRGNGKGAPSALCATPDCGRMPAAGRRVCNWCSRHRGPRVFRFGRRGSHDFVEVSIDGPPTSAELERRDAATSPSYDAWHEWRRVSALEHDDGGDEDDTFEAWVYRHSIEVESDPYAEVDARVDQDRALVAKRRWYY